jgi:hypothetical protein
MPALLLQIEHDEQISSDYRKSCQALNAKIFRLPFPKIRIITNPVSRPQEGRIAIVTTRWARDAMDAAVKGEWSAAYGQVVWFWRRVCWRKVPGKHASQGRR